MNIELQIPDEVARILSTEYADLPRAAIEALALEGYRSNRLSDGQLRQMLGFTSRMQVHAFLKDRGVSLNYSMADLDQDRETSNSLETKASFGNPHAA
jgi:predicted HTH domain antitoxin